jgi:hypothetical protein
VTDDEQLAAIIAWQADNLQASLDLNASLDGLWRVWFTVEHDVTSWHARHVLAHASVDAPTAVELADQLAQLDTAAAARLGSIIDKIARHM